MEELEDEYEYVVLRDDIAKLKRVYLNDIQHSVLLSDPNISKLITATFIMNLKELQDKYLSFLQIFTKNWNMKTWKNVCAWLRIL